MTVDYHQLSQVVVALAAAGLCVIYALVQASGYKACGDCSGKCVIFNTHREKDQDIAYIHMVEQQWLWPCLTAMVILQLSQNIVWRDQDCLNILQSILSVLYMDSIKLIGPRNSHYDKGGMAVAHDHRVYWSLLIWHNKGTSLETALWGWVPCFRV